MIRSTLFAFAAATLLASCNFAAGAPQPPLTEAPLAGADIGGPFELTSSAGETVRWADFSGKFRIVYFGFAYCPDICPTDMSRIAGGLAQYQKTHPELAETIQPMFISIDPERDTPEVLGQFTSAFSDDIIGLTGTPEQIKQAANHFKVFYSRGEDQPGGGYLMDHSNIVYLFGPTGDPLATLPTDQGPEAVAAELAKWVR